MSAATGTYGTNVHFRLTLAVEVAIMSEPLPVDMSNLALSCRPLSQNSELASSQVFVPQNNAMDVHVCLRPEDAALCTLMVMGPAFSATGEPLPGFLTTVPSHKIHLPTAALVTGVQSVWAVDDSNGGKDSILMQVHVVTGFQLEQVAHLATQNTSKRVRDTLRLAVDARSKAIASLLANAAGPVNGPAAALTGLAGNMMVNQGITSVPENQQLVAISNQVLATNMHEYCAPAPGTKMMGLQTADNGTYDAVQVHALQQALVEQRLPTYLYMAMPAVFGVAAKLADHLTLPNCDGDGMIRTLNQFLSRVDEDPQWTQAVYNLFKVSLAEHWSARHQYSMDPGVAVCLGPTGAMLRLYGPGENQQTMGCLGIGCRWANAKKAGLASAFKAIGRDDCEDGGSKFACVMLGISRACKLHRSGQRNLFTSMSDVMPESGRNCMHTQEVAGKIMLMIGAELDKHLSGVAYVAASAASAQQAADKGVNTGNKDTAQKWGQRMRESGRTRLTRMNTKYATTTGIAPNPVAPVPKFCPVGSGPSPKPLAKRAAICDTWLRLVQPTPEAGGHAVFFDAQVTDAPITTCEVNCGALGVASFRLKQLRHSRPLESTALVYPTADTGQKFALQAVNVRSGQQVVAVMDKSKDMTMARCQSVCSAKLVDEAIKIMPTGTQASPVFVQSEGTPGFYQGLWSVGEHVMLTASDKATIQRFQETKSLKINEPMLKGLTATVSKMELPQVTKILETATISSWARYTDMGAGARECTGDVYALEAGLFIAEKAALFVVAAQHAAEMPDVDTLRKYDDAPLSIREQRMRVLMPPVQDMPHREFARGPAGGPANGPPAGPQPVPVPTMPTGCSGSGSVALPSQFWGADVPVMVTTRDAATGMSTSKTGTIATVLGLAEQMGANFARPINKDSAIAQFVMIPE